MMLQCLQQQQLALNNPDFAYDNIADTIVSSNTTARARQARPVSAWDSLRQQCEPVLQSWATKAAAHSSRSRRRLLQAAGTPAASSSLVSNPYLASTGAVEAAYESLLCAQGYTGRLCTKCIFPGAGSEGPYGHFQAGCGMCPAWVTSLVTFVVSRVFDIMLVGLLILTTLVEMKKRRASVQQARKAALTKLATSLSPAAAAAAVAAVTAAAPAGQLSTPVTATASGGSSTPTAAGVDPHSVAAAAMWASGAAALGDQDVDVPLPPADADNQQHDQQQQQQQQVLHSIQLSQQPSAQLSAVDQHERLQQSIQQAIQQQMSRPLQSVGQQLPAAGQLLPHGVSGQLQTAGSRQSMHELEVQGSYKAHQQYQQQGGASGLVAVGSSGPFATPISAFAVPGAVPSAAVAAGVSGVVPPAPAAPAAPVLFRQQRQRRPLKRGPLFAREVTSRGSPNVINYSPAQLTTVELFEVSCWLVGSMRSLCLQHACTACKLTSTHNSQVLCIVNPCAGHSHCNDSLCR